MGCGVQILPQSLVLWAASITGSVWSLTVRAPWLSCRAFSIRVTWSCAYSTDWFLLRASVGFVFPEFLAMIAPLWSRHSHIRLCIGYLSINFHKLTVDQALSFFFASEIDGNRAIQFVRGLLSKKMHFIDCHTMSNAYFSTCFSVNPNAWVVTNGVFADPVYLYYVPSFGVDTCPPEVTVNPLREDPCSSLILVGP